ncbi:protein B4-like [Macrobrachium nipponense]|uniref:protein B4-like n=1 Tax=Macrobrachium nipponense TaxID=159736 RepID=UPI0030C82151
MATKVKRNKDDQNSASATEELTLNNTAEKQPIKTKKEGDIRPLNVTYDMVAVTSSYYSIVLEALTKNDDKKGMSISGLKKFMKENYPEKEWTRCKPFIRKALEKGLLLGVILRPKQSEGAVGLAGRFKLNKDFEAKPPPSKAKTEGKATGSKVSTGQKKTTELVGKVKKTKSEKGKVAKGEKIKVSAKGEKNKTKGLGESKGEGSSKAKKTTDKEKQPGTKKNTSKKEKPPSQKEKPPPQKEKPPSQKEKPSSRVKDKKNSPNSNSKEESA